MIDNGTLLPPLPRASQLTSAGSIHSFPRFENVRPAPQRPIIHLTMSSRSVGRLLCPVAIAVIVRASCCRSFGAPAPAIIISWFLVVGAGSESRRSKRPTEGVRTQRLHGGARCEEVGGNQRSGNLTPWTRYSTRGGNLLLVAPWPSLGSNHKVPGSHVWIFSQISAVQCREIRTRVGYVYPVASRTRRSMGAVNTLASMLIEEQEIATSRPHPMRPLPGPASSRFMIHQRTATTFPLSGVRRVPVGLIPARSPVRGLRHDPRSTTTT